MKKLHEIIDDLAYPGERAQQSAGDYGAAANADSETTGDRSGNYEVQDGPRAKQPPASRGNVVFVPSTANDDGVVPHDSGATYRGGDGEPFPGLRERPTSKLRTRA